MEYVRGFFRCQKEALFRLGLYWWIMDGSGVLALIACIAEPWWKPFEDETVTNIVRWTSIIWIGVVFFSGPFIVTYRALLKKEEENTKLKEQLAANSNSPSKLQEIGQLVESANRIHKSSFNAQSGTLLQELKDDFDELLIKVKQFLKSHDDYNSYSMFITNTWDSWNRSKPRAATAFIDPATLSNQIRLLLINLISQQLQVLQRTWETEAKLAASRKSD